MYAETGKSIGLSVCLPYIFLIFTSEPSSPRLSSFFIPLSLSLLYSLTLFLTFLSIFLLFLHLFRSLLFLFLPHVIIAIHSLLPSPLCLFSFLVLSLPCLLSFLSQFPRLSFFLSPSPFYLVPAIPSSCYVTDLFLHLSFSFLFSFIPFLYHSSSLSPLSFFCFISTCLFLSRFHFFFLPSSIFFFFCLSS